MLHSGRAKRQHNPSSETAPKGTAADFMICTSSAYLEDAVNHLFELFPAIGLLLKQEVHEAHIVRHDGISR